MALLKAKINMREELRSSPQPAWLSVTTPTYYAPTLACKLRLVLHHT
jgi:hypothetical protein